MAPLSLSPGQKLASGSSEMDVVLGGGGAYLDLVANPQILATKHEQKNNPENKKCGVWSLVGECENGHRYAKKLYCGREWCEVCRKQSHNRRIARWLPKCQQLDEMGYWVITFPEEVLPLLRNKRILSEIGKKVASVMRQEGYSKGLRRWHWFGAKDTDYKPHLNVIVEGKYLQGVELEGVKQHIRETILPKGIRKAIGKDMVINYSYTTKPGKMFHILKYVTRATFLDEKWDEEMANKLWNFRNNCWWGKWDGEAKWQVKSKESDMKDVVSLEQSICPKCGKPIKWGSKPVDSIWLLIWGAKEIGDGYYELPELPGEP